MAKKTIILSQSQLDEIYGGDSTYLDGLALNSDLPQNFANQITVNGSVEQGYADPVTTDDFASEFKHNRRNFSLRNRAYGSTIREMTKKEWEEKIVFYEENERLANRQFGATANSQGKSYGATKETLSRYRRAAKKATTGTPEEKEKAAKTMKKMQNNWAGLKVASNQYETAKKIDKDIRPEMKSSTKISGNGKAHSTKTPENGVFLN